ncbi:DUF937 domain-containing protein [Nocardia sp. NPDC049707]|uniref:DUF937 domain-containing protein n=1 Tax=Nocardia sp. NPDC049707 TaxID=3154735 RepID=UPI003413BA57
MTTHIRSGRETPHSVRAFSQVPIAQIADELGVDQATATNAVKAALLGGLQANATVPEGVAASVGALANSARAGARWMSIGSMSSWPIGRAARRWRGPVDAVGRVRHRRLCALPHALLTTLGR